MSRDVPGTILTEKYTKRGSMAVDRGSVHRLHVLGHVLEEEAGFLTAEKRPTRDNTTLWRAHHVVVLFQLEGKACKADHRSHCMYASVVGSVGFSLSNPCES